MTHESNDPVTKPRPVDGAEIVRLAIEWRKLQQQPGRSIPEVAAPVNAAFVAFLTALDTRL